MKIYLACPYSGTKRQRRKRFKAVNKKAGELMMDGHVVFSPISHSHPIAQTMNSKVAICDLNFWMKQDKEYLYWCDEMWVYCLPGWTTSKGVEAEINIMVELNKLVVYIYE